jgi:hypothetical protein
MIYYGCLMVWFTDNCLRGGEPTQIVGQKSVVSPVVPSGQEIAEYIARVLRGNGLHSEAAGITINLVCPMNEEELEEFGARG